MLRSNFELRFDQSHNASATPQKRGKYWKHQRERHEGDIDGDQINRFRKLACLKRPDVSPLQGDHPRILTKPRRQLSNPHIEGIDPLCALLQQAIGNVKRQRLTRFDRNHSTRMLTSAFDS